MALFSRPGSLDFYGDFSLTSVESIESRMSNHSAALGIAQLSKYHEMLARRHFIAEEYLRALDDSQLDIFEMKKLFKGNSTGQRSSIFFRFVARVDCDIQHTIEFFEKSHQIALRRGVDSLSEMDESKFPGAFRNFRTTISIPLYPALEDYEVHRLITSIKGFFHA
jgi:UDP-4-amino-4-deoxy-L-arabinose-oxoglutarate aminotransferase